MLAGSLGHRPPREALARVAGGYGSDMTDPNPEPTTSQAETRPPKDPLRGSRTSGAWLAVIGLALLLLLLIIFILQNTQSVEVSFLGFDGHAPLAVSLLIAAVAGIVLAAVTGALRIIQLRRRVRHTHH